jgi:hypothetical protein
MKKVIIVAIAMVTAAFGLRTNGETKPVISTPTTTVVMENNSSFGAHDVLQEELNDPTAFAG